MKTTLTDLVLQVHGRRCAVMLAAVVGLSLLSGRSAWAADATAPALTVDCTNKSATPGPYSSDATNWGVALTCDLSALKVEDVAVTPRACPAAAPTGAKCFALTLTANQVSTEVNLSAPWGKKGIHFDDASNAGAAHSAVSAASKSPVKATDAYKDIYTGVMTDLGLKAAGTPQNYYDRDANVAVVFYGNDGTTLFLPLPQIDEDDTVTVVVTSVDGKEVDEIRATTCSAPPEVRVGGSASSGPLITKAAGGGPPATAEVTVNHCSADQGIKVSFRSNNQNKDISITTLPLYRLTLGLALIYDLAHSTTFSAQTIKGNSVPSIVEDNHVTGLAAVGFVSLRLLPVDMSRARCTDTDFLHCLGRAVSPAIGINVTDPLNHLYAALNVEPWPGLGLTLGYHFQRTAQLANGYSVGDLLPTGAVPTVMRWEEPTKNFNGFIGLNVDGSLLAKILTGFGK